MARRGSFLSAVNAIVREAERQAREQERENKRIEREIARLEREQLRAEKIAAKERAEYEKQCAIERVLKELNKAEKLLSEQNSAIENFLLLSKDKKYTYSFDELYSNEEFDTAKPILKKHKPQASPIKQAKYSILFDDIKTRNNRWRDEIQTSYFLYSFTSKIKTNSALKILSYAQKADIFFGLLLTAFILFAAIIETFASKNLSNFPFVILVVMLGFWFNFTPVIYFGVKNFNPIVDNLLIKSYYLRLGFSGLLFFISLIMFLSTLEKGALIPLFISAVPLLSFYFNKAKNIAVKEAENKLCVLKNARINFNKLKIEFINDCRKWIIAAVKTKIKNEELKLSYEQECLEWENLKNEFYENQNRLNQNINNYKTDFEIHKKEPVELYFHNIINQLEQPIDYEWKYELFYNETNKLLEISYQLPIYDEFPNLSGLSYIKTKNEIKESYFSESANKKRYEDYIYKLIFSIIAIVFNSDRVSAIETIVFNGQAENIDRAIGKKIKNCVLSLLITKEQFEELNLEYIDPKATFKANKGIAGANISELVPVAPIVTYDKSDSRFIEAYNVLDKVNVGTNLASMDWKDFENLIRDIFEKEFSQNGSDVKITQSSRDGGVDVVAFDPDPIRGGKIVIQAKRYTNVVGVSAVRDLYGTLINEGASKGILITTSDYGSDAHNFAKDKPLTLLNGSHLLHLIKKHGQEAYIDLKEAKSILYGE